MKKRNYISRIETIVMGKENQKQRLWPERKITS
jgi:hypothetical protein